MRSFLRFPARCLLGGVLAGAGFFGAVAVADSFNDVPGSSPFVDDIDWLTDHDIASGFPDGSFRPTEPVNRQQASRWFRNYNSAIEVALADVNPPAGSEFTATVDCPEGSRAVMGSGATPSGLDLTIAESYADETFRWLVRWESDDDAVVDPTFLQAIALCVPNV